MSQLLVKTKYLVLCLSFLLTHIVHAATITVDSADDALTATTPPGGCTLRGAVKAANDDAVVGGCAAGNGIDTIVFANTLANQTIPVVTGGQIEITESVVIDGGTNNITLDGEATNRILLVNDGNNAALTVRNLTFINGFVNAAAPIEGGAAIFYEDKSGEELLVEHCVFRNNITLANGGGGAVDAYQGTIRESLFENNQTRGVGGALGLREGIIQDSIFRGNVAVANSFGGGAVVGTNLLITGSTFVANSADGTIFGGGAVNVTTRLDISNSTFLDNSAIGTLFYGGAISGITLVARHLTMVNNLANTIFGASGASIHVNSLEIYNSIIAGTTNTTDHCVATIVGSSYNLEWTNGADQTSCSSANAVTAGGVPIANIVSTTLADNGGATQTLALPAGSPAIDAADSSGVTSLMLNAAGVWTDASLDQRGFARQSPTLGRSIGAYEAVQPKNLTAAPIPLLPLPLLLLLVGLLTAFAGVRFWRY